MLWMKLWQKLGKQPMRITNHNHVTALIEGKTYALDLKFDKTGVPYFVPAEEKAAVGGEQTAPPHIEKAKFISVWNDRTIEIETDCQVNMNTLEVFNIDKIKDVMLQTLKVLDNEYVELHGERHPVKQQEEARDGEFWYQ